MRLLSVFLPALIVGAVFFAPTAAFADPPEDAPGDRWVSDEVLKLDPVECEWWVTTEVWVRTVELDDEGEVLSAGPWTLDPVDTVVEFWGDGTVDDCADWHQDEDMNWYYQPSPPDPVEDGPKVIVELESVVNDGIVMKTGLAAN